MAKKVTKKKEKVFLRYGMRVRVTEPASFYYGLVGTLYAMEPDTGHVELFLDEDSDPDDSDISHWLLKEEVTPLEASDPDYEGSMCDIDDDDIDPDEPEEEESEDEEEFEIEEAPLLPPLTAVK